MDAISRTPGPAATPGTGVAGLFQEVVRRRQDAPAIVTGRGTLTFSEVSARSAELAAFLRDHGAGPGRIVLLKGDPAPEAVIAILAVLRTGAAYVAVEPGTPAAWIEAIRAEAAPSVLLTVEPDDDPHWLRPPAPGTYDGQPPEPAPSKNDLDATMYVVFTTGSTGRPKGVVTTHRACLARLAQIWRAHPAAPDERACLSAALTSSDSVRQIFGSLLEGTPVVVPPRGSRRDLVRLLPELSRHRVTRLLVTPSLLRSLLALAEDPATELDTVRRWFLSGEPVTPGLLRHARAVLPGARFINLYATTESPVTFGDVTEEEDVVTVGRPPEDTELLLLDSRMRPVPPGEVGEVFVGGEGLTSGYLGDPAATRAAYLPHPARPGRRLYRTGDLGRLTPDGRLELRGRRDGQLQVRGYRVEAEAVEEVLRDHPQVAEAAVVLETMPEGRQALVAFCAPPRGGRPDPADVLRYVRGRLPHYMVPARCVLLDRLPLSRNGKLDRRHLTGLDAVADRNSTPDSARGSFPGGVGSPVQRRIAELWKQALGHTPGQDADVFTEGADSLSAASVVGRLRRDGYDLTVRDVFTTPTIRAFARLAEQRAGRARRQEEPVRSTASRDPIGSTTAREPVPLAPSQRGIWFDTQLDPDSDAYTIVRTFEVHGQLDEAALRAGVEHLVLRHEALRTGFPCPDGEPVQAVRPGPRVAWVRGDDPRRLLADLAERPFDVENGPLVRAALTRTAESRHLFAVAFHHLVCDDVSLHVFFDELGPCYRALKVGETPGLPEPPLGFRDLTRIRLTAEYDARDRLTTYWKTTLADLPDGLGLTRHETPPAAVPRWDWQVDPDRLAAFKTRLRTGGHTLPMAMTAAFAAALHEHTGRTDIVVAIPMAGRDLPEAERVVGCFVNVVPLRISLDGGPDRDTLLGRVREALIGAYTHQELAIGEIAAAAGFRGRLPWDACLNITLSGTSGPRADGLTFVPLPAPTKATQYEVELEMTGEEDGLAVRLRLGPAFGEADGAELAARVARHIDEWTRSPVDGDGVSASEERIT
ncbi:AMP-binding protein [Nonomuraea sp. NPDC050404]|uniref:AMP-binding protein n=1 Tax=Nonomuraea sp. NPDC050404 TaxID=3155783 RepID=UPI0033EE8185